MNSGQAPAQKSIVAVQVGMFVVLTCWIFSGTNHIFYTNLYPFVRGEFSYANDIYLQNSFFYSSSALWWFLKHTGLPLENDLIGFPFHLLVSAGAAYFAYRIIERLLPAPSFPDGMILVLLLAVHDSSILDTTRNGILTWHSNSPTTFAHPFMFGLFYCVLRERFWTASLVGATMALLAVKAAWAPLAVATLFGCFFCRGGLARWLWFLPPLAAAAFLAKNAPLPSDPATRLKLTELALKRDVWESAVDLQPPMRLLALGLSFLIFIALTRRIRDEKLRRLGWAVLIVTIGIVVLTGAYTAYGYRFFPNPSLVSIGPVRATNVYHFFFFLFAYAFLLHNAVLPRWCSTLLLMLLYFLSHVWFEEKKQMFLFALIAAGVLAVAFLAARSLRGRHGQAPDLQALLGTPAGTTVCAMAMVACTSIYTLHAACPGFNLPGFLTLRRWTLPPIERHRLEALAALRRGHEDFTLLVIGSPRRLTPELFADGPLSVDMTANAIAGKSEFLGDFAHFYFDVSLNREHTERGKLAVALLRAINDGATPAPWVLEGLAARRVVVLMPTDLASIFEYQVPVKHLPCAWSALVFDPLGNYEAIVDRAVTALPAGRPALEPATR